MRRLVLVFTFLAASACGSAPAGPSPTPVPTLSVLAIAPSAGSIAGGTAVTITGTLFAAGATVLIGDVPATSVTVVGPTSITAVTPAHAAGTASILVSSGNTSAALPNGFAFVAASGSNKAPVISSITTSGSSVFPASIAAIAEVNDNLTLTAIVTDVETAASALQYAWTSPSGTISGTGASVTWRLPSSLTSAPASQSVGLTVTETYTEAGAVLTNTASSTFVVLVHDSQKEIQDMGEDFLVQFSRQVNPKIVLQNFSMTCDEGDPYDSEEFDVEKNRRDLRITAYQITRLPPVTINVGGRCTFRNRPADACVRLRTQWESIYSGTGNCPAGKPLCANLVEFADGIDYVTAVLENRNWKLCHSDWEGDVTYPSLGLKIHVIR